MEPIQLPSKFKALILNDKESVSHEEINYDFEKLDDDHIVVQVRTAGLGPYDLGFLTGRLTPPNYKTTFGVEGMGVVVKVGQNCDQNLLGKRVGFLSDIFDNLNVRAYSEYSVMSPNHVVILPDNIDDYQGAYLLGNPLTAICLFDSIIKEHNTIVQDTASSALGKMITKMCVKNGIKILNVVRRDENIECLNKIGSSVTLNSTSSSFKKDLEDAVKNLKPSLYLTYQGGSLPATIFDKLPDNSAMCSCGNINNQVMYGFSSTDFIFRGKKLYGFQLFNYLKEISEKQREFYYCYILENISRDNSTIKTEIAKIFKLSEFEEARKFYESNMSSGKIILTP
jgi:NADPH:quinone reductase-like Zn-dependent oxidoreductase